MVAGVQLRSSNNHQFLQPSSFSLVGSVPVVRMVAKWAIMVSKISGRCATVRTTLGMLPRAAAYSGHRFRW